MCKVLVVGDANVDIIVPFPKIIDAEKKVTEFSTPIMQGGGTAGNTAVALAKLDVSTGFVGTIGDDSYGRFVIEDFQQEQVDVTNLIIDKDLNTVCVFAFIDDEGERYLWGWPRVKQSFNEIDKKKLSPTIFDDVSWLHSSGMAIVHDCSARETITSLFKEAFERGITTSFDLNLRVDDGVLDSNYKDAVMEITKYSNYILGSGDDEFEYLGENDWLNNAQEIATNKRICIVRNGKEGSIAISGTERIEAPSFLVDVVDTVGAGDTYNAGFIKGMLTGKTLKESLILGNAVAGYTVSRTGARHSPSETELATFLSHYN